MGIAFLRKVGYFSNNEAPVSGEGGCFCIVVFDERGGSMVRYYFGAFFRFGRTGPEESCGVGCRIDGERQRGE
nr:hypothetical protein [uncultured Acetatifactor sp.]